MPWTIHRYILREMLKLLGLSGGVLVVVISFAAAVRPLSEGLLGPVALMKFVGYTAPTMLGFALPFAGAFAATLVFLRMASDNEVTACSASGLSHAAILTPVLMLGVALTMSLFFLSNYVLPRFYQAATRVVEKDLISALVSQLDKKQPYVLDREAVVIYADRAQEIALEPAAPQPDKPVAEKAVVLHGVAVGEIDADGRVRSDVTARQAKLVVFRDPATDHSWVNLLFEEAMYYNENEGQLVYSRQYSPGRSVRVPSPFADRVEFLSWPQLRRLRQQPQRYDDVQRVTGDLVEALAGETLLQSAQYQLRDAPDRVLTLHGVRRGERFLIRAPRVARQRETLMLLADGDRPVTIDSERAGQVDHHYEAPQATLRIDAQAMSDEPTLDVLLSGQVRIFDVRRTGAIGEHAEYGMPQMVWPDYVLGVPRNEVSMAEALAAANEDRFQRPVAGYRVSPVVGFQRKLLAAHHELLDRITAQLHSRAALAVACTLLLLLGAVLSMTLKSHTALAVYFWSFLLAVVTIIIIHTGTNLVQSGQSLGVSLGVMWSGNVLLAVVVGWSYCRLARH